MPNKPLTPGDSAPPEIAFCCRCATRMNTVKVAGKPRRRCPACGFTHFIEPRVGVGALVTNNGQLLLVKRGMPPEKGKWSLPAGYIDLGESPEAVAVRETWEETGLEIHVDSLIGVFHNPPEQGGAAIFILYAASLTGGQLCAADDADDAQFFDLDELPEIAFKSTSEAVRKLRDRLPAP